MAESQIHLVQEVEWFRTENKALFLAFATQNVADGVVQRAQMENFSKERSINLDNWLKTLDLIKISLAKIESTTSNAAASVKQETAVTRQHADVAAHRLSQKVITAPDVEALQKRADSLQMQNKELRKKKAKPIWKLF